jgi:hypothetical protein
VRLYEWLLHLYPRSYRDEFGDEMAFVFRTARNGLPPQWSAKIKFYYRELFGLTLGALRVQLERFAVAGVSSQRSSIQSSPRFSRATLALMITILVGMVLAIAQAGSVAGDATGSAWRTLLFILLFMLLTMCAAAVVAWAVLHACRHSGVHHLQKLDSTRIH